MADLDIVLDPNNGNVISITGTHNDNGQSPGYVSWSVTNSTGDWIDAICEVVGAGGVGLFITGHILSGATISEGRKLDENYAGKELHVFRWAPGFIFPGSGGGEARFVMPSSGDVTLSVNIVG